MGCMKILVDGYNLLYRIFQKDPMALQEEEREYLVDMLNAYKKIKAHKITIVFDGRSHEKINTRGLTVIFTKESESADDYIKKFVRQNSGTVVVTSDNDILSFVKNCGAVGIKSEEFYSKIEEAFYYELKGFREDEYIGARVPIPGKKLKKNMRNKRKILEKL